MAFPSASAPLVLVISNAWPSFSAAEAAMLPVAAEVDAARNLFAEARKKLDESQKALNDATAALNAKKSFVDALQQALTPLQSAAATLPNVALVPRIRELNNPTLSALGAGLGSSFNASS